MLLLKILGGYTRTVTIETLHMVRVEISPFSQYTVQPKPAAETLTNILMCVISNWIKTIFVTNTKKGMFYIEAT